MKLTITIQSGTLAGRSWDLTEGFLTVGRGGSCNLIFDPNSENMVSTKHAYLELKPDGFYVVDTQSTNGTFVNGNRVQIVKLNSGDSIQFGKNGPLATVFVEMSALQANTLAYSASPPQTNFQSSHNQQPMWGEQFQNQTPSLVQPIKIDNQQYSTFGNDEPPKLSDSLFGLSKPAIKIEEPKSGAGKIIGAVVALAIYGILGLIAMILIIASVGPVAAVIATIIAFIPPIIYILPLIFLDRYDPEPPWLIASAFAWGGIVSIFFSMIANDTSAAIVAGITGNPNIGQLFAIVVSAPVFEELFKGIGVVLVLIFFRKEFDDILDGIVYGGVIGLGFATVENILYYGRGVNDGSIIFLLLVRGVMSPFIHSTFTAMTGIGCGIARESHNTLIKFIAPIGGYIGAVVLHMAWNGGIGVLSGILLGPLGFFVTYTVLGIPFFAIFIGFCIYTMRRQNKILREMLAIDTAQGLITNEQMTTATSAFKSTSWLLGGITSGKFMPRWKFLRAVGKLGLSYWHIQRANAAQGHTGSFQSNPIFKAEVEKWRDKV